jgi:hypothetical protein
VSKDPSFNKASGSSPPLERDKYHWSSLVLLLEVRYIKRGVYSPEKSSLK